MSRLVVSRGSWTSEHLWRVLSTSKARQHRLPAFCGGGQSKKITHKKNYWTHPPKKTKSQTNPFSTVLSTPYLTCSPPTKPPSPFPLPTLSLSLCFCLAFTHHHQHTHNHHTQPFTEPTFISPTPKSHFHCFSFRNHLLLCFSLFLKIQETIQDGE